MIKKNKLYFLTLVPLFSLLLAICSLISIPSVIPFTMQTFALFLSLNLIGGKLSLAAVVVYVMLGALGLPVFSFGGGGIGYLLGPTGGYIFGLAVSCLIFWCGEIVLGKRSIISDVLLQILGLAAIYVSGSIWYTLVYSSDLESGIGSAVITCVIPFIIPDAVKLFLAVSLGKRLSNLINQLSRS